jgi:hypothetical protein
MISLVQGVVVLTALIVVLVLLWRFPAHTALASVAAATALDCFGGQDGIDVGISIYPDDIACAILLCAGCMAIVRWRKAPPRSWWFVLALLGLVALNLVRGAAEFGVKPAGNGVRMLTYLIVPAIALMLLRPVLRLDPPRLARWLILVGLAFTAIALGRWAGVLPAPGVPDNLRDIRRVLHADYTLILCQALLAVFCLQLARGFRWWAAVLAGGFAVEILFLQDRSVWAATIVGLLWLAVRTARSSSRLWLGVAMGALLSLVILISVAPNVANSAQKLIGANVQEIEGSGSTWEWRTKGFEEAIDRTYSGSTEEMLIGPPAGRNLGSSASFASVFIHDRYVDTLAYYGIVGEALLVIWLLLVARSMGRWGPMQRQQDREYEAGRAFLQALLLSALTFFIPYSGSLPLGTTIGLMWVVAMKSRTKKKAVRAPAYIGDLQTMGVEAPSLQSR